VCAKCARTGYKTSLNRGVRSPPEVQYTTPMVREYNEDKKIRKVAVGTVKKSMAAVSAR
jgi:hypothetical protein